MAVIFIIFLLSLHNLQYFGFLNIKINECCYSHRNVNPNDEVLRVLKKKLTDNPWWMHANEKNNPKNLNHYSPWWRNAKRAKYNLLSYDDLQVECRKRGSKINGSRKSLIAHLRLLDSTYDMTDNGYSEAYWIEAGE